MKKWFAGFGAALLAVGKRKQAADARPGKIPADARFLVWETNPGHWEAAARATEKTWWHRGVEHGEWEIELLAESRPHVVMNGKVEL